MNLIFYHIKKIHMPYIHKIYHLHSIHKINLWYHFDTFSRPSAHRGLLHAAGREALEQGGSLRDGGRSYRGCHGDAASVARTLPRQEFQHQVRRQQRRSA